MMGLAGLLALLIVARPIAPAPPLQPPWRTFSEASADAMAAIEVPCPRAPDDLVLRVHLIHTNQTYIFMVRRGRWVLWLVGAVLPKGRAVPTQVWLGDQDPTDDVIRVAVSMSFEEAQRHFKGPCAWIDRESASGD